MELKKLSMEHPQKITNDFVQQVITTGKQYCIFLYKSGPNRNQPPEEEEAIQGAHLRYLFTLRAEGKLAINGPVMDDSELLGVGVFNLTDKEEVKKLLAEDPAVIAGRLIYEIHQWFSIPGDSLP